MVDGTQMVRIFGEEIAVRAAIHTLGGLSAHAGQSELLDWAGNFAQPRPRLHLVHGEPDAMLALQGKLRERFGWTADMPRQGDRVRI